MCITFEEICEKEVINIADGICFGFADDVLMDTETKKVTAIIIRGKRKFFGIFGGEREAVIPWEEIESIGKDTILVKTAQKFSEKNEKENIFQKFLNIFL